MEKDVTQRIWVGITERKEKKTKNKTTQRVCRVQKRFGGCDWNVFGAKRQKRLLNLLSLSWRINTFGGGGCRLSISCNLCFQNTLQELKRPGRAARGGEIKARPGSKGLRVEAEAIDPPFPGSLINKHQPLSRAGAALRAAWRA